MLLTLTTTGISNITNALASGTGYQIAKMALGDYATAYTPTASLTTLRGTEVYKSDIDSYRVISNSRIEFIETLGPSIGNFSFREVALLDSDDNLVAIGVDQSDNQYPKNATTSSAAGNSYTIVAVLEFSDVANAVDLTIVPADAVQSATTTRLGIIEIATQLEVNTGTDGERAVVPSTLESRINKMGSSKTYFVSAGSFVDSSHSGEYPYEPVSFSSALTKATAHSSQEYDLSLVGIGREEVNLGNAQITIPNGLNVQVPNWSVTIGNNLVLQSPSHTSSQRVGRFQADRMSVTSGSLKIQPNYTVQIDSAVASAVSIESGAHKSTSIKINDMAGTLSINSGATGTVHVDIAEYTGSAISVPANLTLMGKINETWYGLPETPESTTTQKGIIERADQDEADAGTDNERAMTPALVRRLTDVLQAEIDKVRILAGGLLADGTRGPNAVYACNGTDFFYVNIGTGLVSPIGSTSISDASLSGGLSYDGIHMYYTHSFSRTLYTIDLTNGIATRIGSMGHLSFGTFLRGTTLHGITANSSTSTMQILSINKTTGVTTIVGTFTLPIGSGYIGNGGIAIRNNVIYLCTDIGAGNVRLYVITPSGWSVDAGKALGNHVRSISSITFVGSTLYGLGLNSGGSPRLFSISTSTGVATDLRVAANIGSLETIP